ncbi:MAG TPA: L,D-transpeptidase [Gammaproteobacteria bacterium]|nr:L,D-transpeptidase [Gammaproteobacteria bacterium]
MRIKKQFILNGLVSISVLCLLLSPFTTYAKNKTTKSAMPAWCRVDGYTCLRVKSGQSWEILFPDERERGIVMRVNRTSGVLYAGVILKVPNNLSEGDLLDYAPFPRRIEPIGEKIIVIDLKQNAWGAYVPDGTLIRWGPATGGKAWCSDIDQPCRTKSGAFRIYSLGSSNCISSKFPVPDGGAPMPFCMFFNGGQALHGSPGAVMKANVSHGCVRLFVPDAEWLRYDFVEPPRAENNYRGTKVIVLPYATTAS